MGHRERNCVQVVVSNFCNIPEGKGVSCLRKGMSVRRPYKICMRTVEDVKELHAGRSRK